MIIISNSQRDYIVKYIEIMCEALTGDDNKTYKIKRMARKLQRQLVEKQPVKADELSALLKYSSPRK